jgi:hypothetical protein
MTTLCGGNAIFIDEIGEPRLGRALALVRSRSTGRISEFQDA